MKTAAVHPNVPAAVPGGKNVYVCEICGFAYVGDDAPDICPVCKAPKDAFELLESGLSLKDGHILGAARQVDERVVNALKARHLRNAGPLSLVAFDNRLQLLRQALGTHTAVSRVQGNRLKAKREIRIASVFRNAPAAFLHATGQTVSSLLAGAGAQPGFAHAYWMQTYDPLKEYVWALRPTRISP